MANEDPGFRTGDERAIEQFIYDFQANAGQSRMLCLGCARLGRCRLGVVSVERTGESSARALITSPGEFEGGPGVVHGGWTAALFDEVLAQLLVLNKTLAVTQQLTVRYHKPAPVRRDMALDVEITGHEGSVWRAGGQLRLAEGGPVLASAEGAWVERDVGHFSRHRRWLADLDDAAAAGERGLRS